MIKFIIFLLCFGVYLLIIDILTKVRLAKAMDWKTYYTDKIARLAADDEVTKEQARQMWENLDAVKYEEVATRIFVPVKNFFKKEVILKPILGGDGQKTYED